MRRRITFPLRAGRNARWRAIYWSDLGDRPCDRRSCCVLIAEGDRCSIVAWERWATSFSGQYWPVGGRRRGRTSKGYPRQEQQQGLAWLLLSFSWTSL